MTEPERLSDDEHAYHGKLMVEVRAAQAAWASWSAHLAAKYKLGAADGIDEDGAVHRAPEPSSTEPDGVTASPDAT